MKKPDETTDIDKLMEIATSSSEKVEFEDTEVEKFIHDFGIQAGDTRVPTYTIYYHYDVWRKQRKRRGRKTFFNQFNKHFEKIKDTYGMVYMLDPEPFDMTPEGYFKARKLVRKEKNARRKAEAKKKQSEASIFEEGI